MVFVKGKPGESEHEKLRAQDLDFFDEEGKWMKVPRKKALEGIRVHKAKLQHIGDKWESLSPYNYWGGNFKNLYDPGHFERRTAKRTGATT